MQVKIIKDGVISVFDYHFMIGDIFELKMFIYCKSSLALSPIRTKEAIGVKVIYSEDMKKLLRSGSIKVIQDEDTPN